MSSLLKQIRVQVATTLLVCAATIVFIIVAMEVLGDPVAVLLPPDAPQSQVDFVRHDLGLDRPFPERVARRLGHLVTGDFGNSYATHDPAGELVLKRLPATVALMLTGAALGLPVGLALGLTLVALRRTPLRSGPMAVALGVRAIPSFVVAIIAIRLFAAELKWLPPSGSGTFRQLLLPATVLALDLALSLGVYLHDKLYELERAPFATVALGKGLSRAQVERRHLLPAALPGFASYVTFRLSGLAGGALVVEQVFSYQGLAQLALFGLRQRDLPVVLACAVAVVVTMGIIRLLFDLVQPLFDPQQRTASS